MLDINQIEKMRATGWSPATCLPGTQKDGSPPKTLRFNIGGQVFEASEAVLTRDKGSVLAALCLADSPMQLNEDGAFYFDRDWWVPEHSCTRLSALLPRAVYLTLARVWQVALPVHPHLPTRWHATRGEASIGPGKGRITIGCLRTLLCGTHSSDVSAVAVTAVP